MSELLSSATHEHVPVWVEIYEEEKNSSAGRKRQQNVLHSYFVPGTVSLSSVIKGDQDCEVTLETGTVTVCRNRIFRSNDQGQIASVADLTGLTFLEEPNILHSLRCRFEQGQIYTSVANITVAVNPYENLPIYSKEMMDMCKMQTSRSRIPHIYSVAEQGYANLTAPFSKRLRDRPQNQSLIVCGESGSGKTENAKHIMRFLANRRHSNISGEKFKSSQVELQIIQTNSVLEAFGNASTKLNHNSSRFGKFTKMYIRTSNILNEEERKQYDQVLDRVVGASTETYLLEKSRVVLQSKGERNFHIFYEIFECPSEMLTNFFLVGSTAKDFAYTLEGVPKDSGAVDRSRKVDRVRFEELIAALTSLGIPASDHEHILGVVAAILHLGNIEFIEDSKCLTEDACVIANQTFKHLEFTARLLGVSTDNLQKILLYWIKAGGNECKIRVSQAKTARDAFAKSVYDALFQLLVKQINITLEQDIRLPWIGILDVFGFEIFDINSFEQFMINFTNEKLQQHFNNSILKSEQVEYLKESLVWTPLEVPDGKEVIDLIEKGNTSILSLVDSHCVPGQDKVEIFMSAILKYHGSNPSFLKVDSKSRRPSNQSRNLFCIKHYAGVVEYTTDEFIPKNADRCDPRIAKLLRSSSKSVVASLFPETQNNKNSKAGSKLFSSVSKPFVQQLNSLTTALQETQSYFVRCVKPNTEEKPLSFESNYVRPQLKYGGLVQAVKMLKCGYPSRVAYEDIFKWYLPLLTCDQNRVEYLDRRHFCLAVLSLFGLQSSDFQLGLTKVFFKSEKSDVLHMVLNYDKKFTPEKMKSLFAFLARWKWKKLVAVTRSSCRLFRRIERQRSVVKFQKTVMLLVNYHKTFRSLHRKVSLRLNLQTSLRVVLAKLHMRELWQEKQAEIIQLEELKRIESQRILEQKAIELKRSSEIEAEQVSQKAVTEMNNVLNNSSTKQQKDDTPKFSLLKTQPFAKSASNLKLLDSDYGITSLLSKQPNGDVEDEKRIANELTRVSSSINRVSSYLEEEICTWMCHVLGVRLSAHLFDDLYTGELLVQLVQRLVPRLFSLKIHPPTSIAAIDSNINKFLLFAEQLGLSKSKLFTPQELRNCDNSELELKILQVLLFVKNKFPSRTRYLKQNSSSLENVRLQLEVSRLTSENLMLKQALAEQQESNKSLEIALQSLNELNVSNGKVKLRRKEDSVWNIFKPKARK